MYKKIAFLKLGFLKLSFLMVSMPLGLYSMQETKTMHHEELWSPDGYYKAYTVDKGKFVIEEKGPLYAKNTTVEHLPLKPYLKLVKDYFSQLSPKQDNETPEVSPLVSALSFSPDNVHLVSAEIHGTIKIWDLSSKKCISTITIVKDTTDFHPKLIFNSKHGKHLHVAYKGVTTTVNMNTRKVETTVSMDEQKKN